MTSDGDIKFPPGERREKPKFEPPPWEREQFEEMARRTQKEEDQLAASGAQAVPAPQVAAAAVSELAPTPEAVDARAETVGDEPEGSASSEPAEKAELDEKHVELLMMGLRAEEPRPEKTAHRVIMASGIVSVVIGLTVMTWAIAVMAASRQRGPGEVLFQIMLLVFGLGFVAGGVWVMFKSLRQQGVL